jgi:phage terminase large subunit
VLKGGRGSAKSWTIARILLLLGTQQPERILCAREYMASIKTSVHQLLVDQIRELGLSSFYRIGKSEIVGINGTQFFFGGLQNIESLKSVERLTTIWLEEAQTVSEYSYQTILPTLRSEGSSIWISFNPCNEKDPTWQRYVANPPDNCIVIDLNWRDNPWFTKTLNEERIRDKERLSEEDYNWIWEGQLRTISNACIFKGKFVVEDFPEADERQIHYLGADFGFAEDPATLIRCHVRGDDLYIDYEMYKTGVELDSLAKEYDTVPGSRKWTILADCARPDTISYLARKGFRIRGAEKGPNSVEEGIRFLKSFRRIVIHPRCIHTTEEFRRYSYKTDKLTGEVTPLIVDDWNHAIDAIRYATSKIQKRNGTSIDQWAALAQ